MLENEPSTVSALQQSLVSVAAGVAELERQRSADLLTIDELTQQTVELKARVDAYDDDAMTLRAQADVDRRSLAEAGALIDQLRREVAELRAKVGVPGPGPAPTPGPVEPKPVDPVPPPPAPDKPAERVPNIRIELVGTGIFYAPSGQKGERWGSERRWVWPTSANGQSVDILVDLHDSGQVRLTFDRADWRTPVSREPLVLDVTVDIDGKRRLRGPIRVHHHTRPTMVFDRREHPTSTVGQLLFAGRAATGVVLPRLSGSVPESDLAAMAAGKWPWESFATASARKTPPVAYDRVSEEYGLAAQDWSGGAGALLNEAAMLMPAQVAYLLSRDPRAWAETVRLADSSGNYAVHYRLPEGRYPLAHETGDLPQLNTEPAVTLYTASGARLPVPDVAHQHSLAYLAYLLTGERYYYEELQAWLTYDLLYRPKGPDRLRGLLFSGELRATAWAIRSLLHLVLATDSVKQADLRLAYTGQLLYNLRWMKEQFATPGAPGYRPTGLVTLSPWRQMAMLQFVRAEPKPQWAATWQHHLLAYVLGECARAGFEEAVPMRDHLLKVAEAVWRYSPSKYLAAWGNHAVLTEPAVEVSGWIMNMERTFAGMPAADPHRTSFADPITPDYLGWYRAAVVAAVDAGQAWAREALSWLDAEIPKSRWKSVPLVWRIQPS